MTTVTHMHRLVMESSTVHETIATPLQTTISFRDAQYNSVTIFFEEAEFDKFVSLCLIRREEVANLRAKIGEEA